MKIDMCGKKLLILGGNLLSCEIIKRAKELGVYTVVTDYNDPSNSPGKKIADESFAVSAIDVDGVVDLIRREHIDGVLTGFSDMLLPYYADICAKANVPCYGTREQFEIFSEKKKYKTLCQQFGVPTIREYGIEYLQKDKIESIHFPVIVKPSANSGARGIKICHNAAELREAYQSAVQASTDGCALIEQYVDEREVTVFWIFQDGEYYVSAIGNRHVKHNQEGVIPLPAGYSYPASITGSYLKNTVPNVKRMLKSVGIKNGMMFMQCKVVDNECLLYDVGYRLTGTLEYKNLQMCCGYDPLEMMIRFAVTGRMAEKSIARKINPYMSKYTYNISCLCSPGVIAEIRGLDKVMEYDGVIDAVIAHYPGEEITPAMKGLLSQITVRIFGASRSKENMGKDIETIQNMVHILSNSGEEIGLPGIEMTDLDNMLADIDQNVEEL